MIPRSKLSEIGSFNKPHGIHGEISATFDDDDIISCVENAGHIFVEFDGLMVPFTLTEWRAKGSSTTLLKLKGIADELQAALLANKPIYLESELLGDNAADADGFFLEDLIGFTVVSEGRVIGTISDYDDSTANVLLIVKAPDGKELLIPADEDFIADINVDTKTIEMIIPNGLLDL